MSKIYDYPCEGDEWVEFLTAMHSGKPVQVTEGMADYWLGVLPPIYMNRVATLPDGRKLRAWFGCAEGEDYITAFWMSSGAIYCCRTNEINRYC